MGKLINQYQQLESELNDVQKQIIENMLMVVKEFTTINNIKYNDFFPLFDIGDIIPHHSYSVTLMMRGEDYLEDSSVGDLLIKNINIFENPEVFVNKFKQNNFEDIEWIPNTQNNI